MKEQKWTREKYEASRLEIQNSAMTSHEQQAALLKLWHEYETFRDRSQRAKAGWTLKKSEEAAAATKEYLTRELGYTPTTPKESK
jgi:hypothetical protein